VLALIAEGRSNAAVAAGLFVSEKAISKHIANIFMKLDCLHRQRTTTVESWPCWRT